MTSTTTREEALERDNYRCRVCGQLPVEVHHIVYRSQGGTDDLNNLVSLCRGCHDAIHSGRLILSIITEPTFEVFFQRKAQ